MFLVWLGEQITSRGVGNGSSLIIFAGIVARLPQAAGAAVRARPPGLDLDRHGARRHRDGVRRRRLHRLHGARAAARADHLSAPPGRQQDVRGAELVPAAQAQHLGRHSADFRLVAAAAADDGRPISPRARRPTASFATITDAARPRRPALPHPLCRADRLLRLLLYGDGVQPRRHRRQSEEARRLRPRRQAGRAHRAIHRPNPHPHHRARRRLSRR